MQKILLCADSESLAHPELLGLDDVNLDAISWLTCFSQASELRERLNSGLSVDEVWVVSSDDVEAINLIAALRKDNPDLVLLLVVDSATGSIMSRALNAGANATLTLKGFSERFALECLRNARMQDVVQKENLVSPDPLPFKSVKEFPVYECAKKQSESCVGQAFTFSVFSGSGGAGKSTVSAIAASIATCKRYKTLLIDCDLQFGDMHKLLGIENPVTLDDVLEDPDKLVSLSSEYSESAAAKNCLPCLLACPGRLEQSEVIGQHLASVIDSAVALFDVIVVNTGANWADYHATLLERSDCSLLLVDQRASSVRACQHALELCSRMGVASGSFAYAVNHCERGALFSSLDVAFVMQGAHVYELKEGGPAVEEMLGAGLIQDLMSSKNDLCASIEEMLLEILPEQRNKDKQHIKLGKSDVAKTSSKRSSRRRRGVKKQEESKASFLESNHPFVTNNHETKANALWR